MDPLSDILSFLEPRSYFVGGFEAGGEWSIRFGPHQGIKCYSVRSGACWLTVEDAGEPVLVVQGDCVLLPHGGPFRVASDPALPPVDWRSVLPGEGAGDGALARVNDGGEVTILGGHFELVGPQSEFLLAMLPPVVHLRRETDRETLRWAFDRMRRELTDARPGAILIAQQLVYMILVQALRLHLDGGNGVGWLFALSDKHIGAAIAAIHREPAKRWTVSSLAAEVGMSRSGFAARFRQAVGSGPIDYLTRWRMLLAARSVSRGEPVGAIAHSLGYKSESAFSTAFKRVMGRAPRDHLRPAAVA